MIWGTFFRSCYEHFELDSEMYVYQDPEDRAREVNLRYTIVSYVEVTAITAMCTDG